MSLSALLELAAVRMHGLSWFCVLSSVQDSCGERLVSPRSDQNE